MKILIDNGHGVNTPGKCSPDGVFREYRYTREIARAVVQHLQYRGFDAQLLTPEEYDVSLKERVNRVNTWCKHLGRKNVCLVSLHTNASGTGKDWMNARGWSCYTSRGQTAGDRLATCLYEAAEIYLAGHKLRKDYTDSDPDLESDFYLLRHTQCAAALSENLFHDNSEDCIFLESVEGKQAIVSLHVEGVVRYVRGV